MRRVNILSLFVIAANPSIELSELDSFRAIPRREFGLGQKVWADDGHVKCCGLIIGFMYLVQNDLIDDGWQYGVRVTDVGEGYAAPVEWFKPEHLELMTLEDAEAVSMPIN